MSRGIEEEELDEIKLDPETDGVEIAKKLAAEADDWEVTDQEMSTSISSGK